MPDGHTGREASRVQAGRLLPQPPLNWTGSSSCKRPSRPAAHAARCQHGSERHAVAITRPPTPSCPRTLYFSASCTIRSMSSLLQPAGEAGPEGRSAHRSQGGRAGAAAARQGGGGGGGSGDGGSLIKRHT